MTKIKPFRAFRPTRDKAHLVISKQYYAYKKSILKAKLESNPFTFIHVITPDYFMKNKPAPGSRERYEMIRKEFERFLSEGILFKEEEPSFYIYRQTKNGHAYMGLIAGASVEDYDEGHIKKHEATLTSRENMFADYLEITGFNAEPVLISYPKDEIVEDILNLVTLSRPEYEFTTTDIITHELWIIPHQYEATLIEHFDRIKDTYIADGHHRCSSSSILAQRKKGKKDLPSQHFLALFMNEERLKIYDFNRLILDFNGHTKKEIKDLLSEKFTLKKSEEELVKPTKEHQFTMYLGNKWYILEPKPGSFDQQDVVDCLDAEILTKNVLNPIFGIHDLKTDERIQFISGDKGMKGIKKAIDKGDAKIGFALYPVTIDHVKQVADENRIMPPKSTWIEPKLRSGLTIYDLEND
ncbi:MAG: DUF1015 family protein [Crocinitomicaceae bacterium]|nr:DUF1015 domain-containing protein [Crocinitomicaceae bacterium]